ncbi:MAG: LysR family transcriptional regulator [Erysipelotrichaceae bacterium]|nr:LysR family transcriptional regulator [Erysipelotrichaceae bacterium]
MTLQQLHYALMIAREGSMNKAAEKLYISQPNLTNAIKQLEEETGITIFERSNKGVTITEEGNEFLFNARQIYSQYEMLEEKYGKKKDAKKRFAVSCQHYSFATKAFVQMVRHYDTLYYEFAIRETKTLDVIRDVAEARSEVGILYLSNYNRKYIEKLLKNGNLEFSPLVSVNAMVYLYKDHPLAKESSITLKQLQDYPCLIFEQGSESLGYLAEEILTENIYDRVIHTTDRATNLNLMRSINAYTLCSGIISEELNGGDYIAVPYEADEDNPNASMEIGYITRKNAILSKIAKTYIQELKNYLA